MQYAAIFPLLLGRILGRHYQTNQCEYRYPYHPIGYVLAPYKNDPTIQPLIPANDLPSYPSEDAVIAYASSEVLKFLFPGEIEFLASRAEEHTESRLWAGANVQSDLDAGQALGKLVAERIIAYAKTDKMGIANNQPGVAQLRADATARGIDKQWTSRDLPSRPPMLPFFFNVKTWNFDQATMIANRPAPPPAVGSAEFETAMNELRDMSKNRTREQFRIASFWADGTGTYTPPGHWNRKAAELIYDKQPPAPVPKCCRTCSRRSLQNCRIWQRRLRNHVFTAAFTTVSTLRSGLPPAKKWDNTQFYAPKQTEENKMVGWFEVV